ncbi:MAG TPA: hypothetical protein VFP84_29760, partial [Kofleriaceae bacterium]|nr:hypothetical protein [Kofleriaceae bacterium]
CQTDGLRGSHNGIHDRLLRGPLGDGRRDVDRLLEERSDGERLVAEVKTGEVAPRLATAATRRQLLEYLVAFGVDGVLLVCPELGTIQRVAFVGLIAAGT